MNYNGGLKGEETDYNGGLKGEETDYTPPDEPSTFVLARESDDDDPGNQFFGILYLRSSNQDQSYDTDSEIWGRKRQTMTL